jgi:methylmalonyl-CoA mutase N-terminal domain/subunit
MEEAAYDYFRKIDELGGMVQAAKQDFPQREIADASWRFQTEVDEGKRFVVGVNRHQEAGEEQIEILRIDPALEGKQMGRLQATRARRDSSAVEARLGDLKEAAAAGRNLMHPLLECARARCSEGEMIGSLQEVFGSYRESPIF